MFVVGVSYVSLLQVVLARCSDVAFGFICEVADDGAVLAGIELDIPLLAAASAQHHIFLWSCPDIIVIPPYEQVAFQAIVILQSVYGFVVVDYNYQALLYYRGLAQCAFSFVDGAAHGLQLEPSQMVMPFFPRPSSSGYLLSSLL